MALTDTQAKIIAQNKKKKEEEEARKLAAAMLVNATKKQTSSFPTVTPTKTVTNQVTTPLKQGKPATQRTTTRKTTSLLSDMGSRDQSILDRMRSDSGRLYTPLDVIRDRISNGDNAQTLAYRARRQDNDDWLDNLQKAAEKRTQRREALDKLTLSEYDQNLPASRRQMVQEAKDAWAKAKDTGDTEGMRRAHEKAENVRSWSGYSGGSAGDQYIEAQLTKDDQYHLNQVGQNKLKKAMLDRQKAIEAGDIQAQTKASAEIQRIRNEDTYKNKPSSVDAYGRTMLTDAERRADAASGVAGMKSVGTGIAGSLLSLAETGNQAMRNYNRERWGHNTQANANNVEMLEARLALVESGEGNPEWGTAAEIRHQLGAARAAREVLDDGTTVDPNLPGQTLMRKSQEYAAEALEGKTGVEKLLMETALSMGQNAPGIALGLIPGVGPALGLGLMSAQAAGSRAFELNEQNAQAAYASYMFGGEPEDYGAVTPGEALLRGALSGLVEAGTEAVPLIKLTKLLKGKGGQNFLKNVLTQMGIEGTEEGVAYTANFLLDKAAQDPNAEWTLEEFGHNALIGAVSGGMMATGGQVIGDFISSSRTTTQPQERTVESILRKQEEQPVQEQIPSEAKASEPKTVEAKASETARQALERRHADVMSRIQAAQQDGSLNDQEVYEGFKQELQAINAEEAQLVQNERQEAGQVSQNFGEAESHIDNRTAADVSARNVKAFQFDHPQLHQYFAEAALALKNDAEFSLASQRSVRGEGVVAKRSEQLAQAEGLGLTRQEIVQVCNDIIEDNGQENYAAAKKVEIILDGMLSKGYIPNDGGAEAQVAANTAYIEAKSAIPGAVSGADRYVRDNSLALELGEVTEAELRQEYEAQTASVEPVAARQVSAPAARQTTAQPHQTARAASSNAVGEMAKTLGEKGNEAMQSSWDGKGNQMQYIADFVSVYNQALTNTSQSRIQPLSLTDAQTRAAYKAGIADRKTSIASAKTAAEFAPVAGKDAGLVYDDYVKTSMDTTVASEVNAVAKMLGLRVQMVDYVEGGNNASIQGSVVQIEKNNPEPVRFLFGHELTHRVQDLAPESYRAFRDYVMQSPESQAQVQKIMAAHQRKGNKITQEGAMDEVAADYAGYLIQDKQLMSRFIQQNKKNQSLLGRVLTALKDMAAKLTGKHKAQVNDAISLLEKAVGDAAKQVRKLPANKNTAQTDGAKFSVKINPYQGKSLSSDSSVYDYDFLVKLPDMPVVEMPSLSEVKTDGNVDREKAIGMGYQNAKAAGRKVSDSVCAVKNRYTNREVRISRKGLGHSLDGGNVSRLRTNARLTAIGGSVIQNAVPVNALKPTNPQAHGTYAMACLLKSGDKNVVAIVTVEQHTNNVSGIDYVDVAHSINGRLHAKKESSRSSTRESDFVSATATFTVSIADFLGIVNETHQSILSDDVLAHLGETRNAAGHYTDRVRFSLKTPIEETRDLIALHNLSEDKLMKSLDLGGFPMPSIAVTAADIPHTNFGDITLVMNKSTVDPKADKKNVVYSADAWTPTFPRIEYDVNRDAELSLYDKVRKVGSKLPDMYSNRVNVMAAGIEDYLYNEGSEAGVIAKFKSDSAIKALYLADKGQTVEVKTREVRHEKKTSELMDDVLKLFEEDVETLRKMPLNQLHTKYAEGIKKVMLAHGRTEQQAEMAVAKKGGVFGGFDKYISRILRYAQEPAYRTETVTDTQTMEKDIDRKVDAKGFDKWLGDMFRGLIKDTGVRNEKETFTPSGRRRSFQQTHYPVTLDNIAKAMSRQNGGDTVNATGGFYGVKTLRAGTAKRFKSIADMHKSEDRLKNLTEDEAKAVNDALDQRLMDITHRIYEKKSSKGTNQFIEYDTIGQIIMEAATGKTYTVDSIHKVFSQYGYKLGNQLCMDIRDLLFDVSQMPVHIFEAKPERAVRFDEVLAAVVPDTVSAQLMQRLNDEGVTVIEYEQGNDADRLEKVNAVEDAKFSLKGVSSYEEMVARYGAIPQGEDPRARDIQVPQQTEDGKKVSRTVRTILEAGSTTDEMVPTIQQMVEEGEFSYEVAGDKEAIETARATITEKGWEAALVDWIATVSKGEVSKQNVATGWALYDAAAQAGNTKTAADIMTRIVIHQRNAAQAVQATRILKRMSPSAQLYGIQRSVQNMQEELNTKYGDKAPNLQIPDELIDRHLNGETQEERDQAEIEIYQAIGKQMPSTFQDKWNAWRYLAMLFNVRTHLRNITGNAVFAIPVSVKNVVGTVVESSASAVSGGKIQRTKGVATPELVSAAWGDYKKVESQIMAGGKYDDSAAKRDIIQDSRIIFKTRFIEWLRRMNSGALQAEDGWACRPHYANALAQYCSANGITAEQIRTGEGIDQEVIDKARGYAIREAQKSTFRDFNDFSNFISSMGRYEGKSPTRKAVSILTEGLFPFRKTPANIMARAVEYSPANLANVVAELVYNGVKAKKGKKQDMLPASQIIDNFASGLTGSGLFALGAYLASQGLLIASGDDDDEQADFDKLLGRQTNAVELESGANFTIDWMAPQAIPVLMGAEYFQIRREDDGSFSFQDLISAVSTVTNPMLELSCLSSLNDTLDALTGFVEGDVSSLVTVAVDIAVGYLTQGIPTLFGQAERSSQEERMTTYTDKNLDMPPDWQYTLGQISAKIPGVDYNQIPYIDAWGRTENEGTLWARILSNFINPSYTSKYAVSNMEAELQRLYDATGESVFPQRAERKLTINGTDIDLNAEQYIQYAQKLLVEMTSSSWYASLSDAAKAEMVTSALAVARESAKLAVFPEYESKNTAFLKASSLEKDGIPAGEFLMMYGIAQSQESSKTADGEVISDSLAYNKLMALRDSGMLDKYDTEQQKKILGAVDIGGKFFSMSDDALASTAAEIEEQKNAPSFYSNFPAEKVDMVKGLEETCENFISDYDSKGEAIDGQGRQDKIKAEIKSKVNSGELTAHEAYLIFHRFYDSDKNNPWKYAKNG